MSVVLKRSEKHMPQECRYGCCTEVYGKNVKLFRRRIKHSGKNSFKREVREGAYT